MRASTSPHHPHPPSPRPLLSSSSWRRRTRTPHADGADALGTPPHRLLSGIASSRRASAPMTRTAATPGSATAFLGSPHVPAAGARLTACSHGATLAALTRVVTPPICGVVLRACRPVCSVEPLKRRARAQRLPDGASGLMDRGRDGQSPRRRRAPPSGRRVRCGCCCEGVGTLCLSWRRSPRSLHSCSACACKGERKEGGVLRKFGVCKGEARAAEREMRGRGKKGEKRREVWHALWQRAV